MPTRTKDMKHLNLVAVTSAVVCLTFALLSAVWFWALILTVRPETVITRWEQEYTGQIDQNLAQDMLYRLTKSVAINPLDANSYLLMASYYELLSEFEPIKYADEAELSYKLAIRYQPTWEYSWARLASYYSSQHKFNEEAFIHAFLNSVLSGPYEQKSQKIIIPLIFKHWEVLQKYEKEKALALNIIAHALKYYRNAEITLNYAYKYRQLKVVEPLTTELWHISKLNQFKKEIANEE